jgi:peptidoglycan/LPS O-acetylase OafA/YrhL
MSLAAVFDPRWNSLNVLRLVFAAAVIVSHAWPLGGFGADPTIGGLSVGGWAVGGFFVISGYLISGSRRRTSAGAFALRRLLRLGPGLWACLAVIVLVFVPLASIKEPGTFPPDAGSVTSFLVRNATLTTGDFGITGTLDTVPHEGSWNGSLWTLRFEALCYLCIAIVLSFAWARRTPAVIASLFALFAVAHFANVEGSVIAPDSYVSLAVELGAYFLAGATMEAYAYRIPISDRLAMLMAGVLVGASIPGHVTAVAALPFAYLCLWLGVRLPLQRVAHTNDISYGVYIYAFPLQQLLVLYGGASHGVVVYILLATVATMALAWLSWIVVEQPAMALAKRRRRPAAPRDTVRARS